MDSKLTFLFALGASTGFAAAMLAVIASSTPHHNRCGLSLDSGSEREMAVTKPLNRNPLAFPAAKPP